MGCFVYIASDERLREQVELHDRLTDVIASGIVRKEQIAILSWDGETVDGIGIVRPGARVANYKIRVTIDFVVEIDEPLSPEAVDKALKAQESPPHELSLSTLLNRGGQLEAERAAALQEALVHLEPWLASIWSRLEGIIEGRTRKLWRDDREPIAAYEREALGAALDIAGIDRSRILRSWQGDSTAPFLEGIGEFRIGEDAIVSHDAQVFGDWDLIGSTLVGTATFQQGNRHLTVLNANRTPVETTLGVDLLYYSHDYRAYVFVQYKRLRKEPGGWLFRPSRDRNFDAELERMRTISAMDSDSDGPDEFRISGNFCFVKFCKPSTDQTARSSPGELAGGMYIPLDFFDVLLQSGRLEGPRGGVAIGFDNVGRWITSTGFVGLVERAWIGTRGLTSEQVTEIVRSGIDANRSLLLAHGRDLSAGP